MKTLAYRLFTELLCGFALSTGIILAFVVALTVGTLIA